jgi:cell wall-associated NlpC family hydrolase
MGGSRANPPGDVRALVSTSILVAIVLPATATAAASTGGTTYPGTATTVSGGTAPGQVAEEPTPTPPSGPPGTATLLANGKARAPAGAPAAVKRALRAGNRLQDKSYRFGGGHLRWEDEAYDCSGATSYALRGIGGLNSPIDSSGFMRWGAAGAGAWITTYANPNHVFAVIAGLRLDTGMPDERGPRWRTTMRPTGAFTARHPAGF